MKPPKEQLELRQKWLAALRSGKYEQAKGYLYNGTGYCCLGVACVVAGLDPIEGKNGWQFETERHYLPESVRDALGLATSDGAYGSREGIHCLGSAEKDLPSDNDNKGKTLEEIADIIEANPTIWAEYEWPEPPTEEEMSGD